MLAFIPWTSPQRGDRPGSFVLIRRAVRLIQSINRITVYGNEFSASGAGCSGELAAPQ